MMIQMHHGHEILSFIEITSLFEFLNSTTEFFVSFFEVKENPFSIHEQSTVPSVADIAPPVSDRPYACA